MKINGPIEIVYVVIVLFAVLTVLFLMGKGSSLIAGYNHLAKEEKEKYDQKKLCRTMAGCFGFIDLLLIITCLLWKKLPFYFTYILVALIFADVIVTIILMHAVCKKKSC